MTELQRLLLAYDQHRAARRPCALATVVEVLGSAYRRPGARMLVTEDGELTGAISGGAWRATPGSGRGGPFFRASRRSSLTTPATRTTRATASGPAARAWCASCSSPCILIMLTTRWSCCAASPSTLAPPCWLPCLQPMPAG
ncbi:XdhC family protein [Hymenobacter sp. BRD128]|nr:XdhC family protein [Hymenobacter sp. BRD128]